MLLLPRNPKTYSENKRRNRSKKNERINRNQANKFTNQAKKFTNEQQGNRNRVNVSNNASSREEEHSFKKITLSRSAPFTKSTFKSPRNVPIEKPPRSRQQEVERRQPQGAALSPPRAGATARAAGGNVEEVRCDLYGLKMELLVLAEITSSIM